MISVTESVSEAEALQRVLKARAVDPREAARWIAEIAEAIGYLDSHGIRFKDLNPAEILIGKDGSSRLSSLALRCVKKGGPPSIGILGTPAYMSPEEVRSEANFDVRCSVYRLGVVLYELLTRVLPFPGSKTAEVFHNILDKAPRAPRSIRPSIPKKLEAICLKAMARKPDDRYATAEDLALSLRGFLNDQPERHRSFWKRK